MRLRVRVRVRVRLRAVCVSTCSCSAWRLCCTEAGGGEGRQWQAGSVGEGRQTGSVGRGAASGAARGRRGGGYLLALEVPLDATVADAMLLPGRALLPRLVAHPAVAELARLLTHGHIRAPLRHLVDLAPRRVGVNGAGGSTDGCGRGQVRRASCRGRGRAHHAVEARVGGLAHGVIALLASDLDVVRVHRSQWSLVDALAVRAQA